MSIYLVFKVYELTVTVCHVFGDTLKKEIITFKGQSPVVFE